MISSNNFLTSNKSQYYQLMETNHKHRSKVDKYFSLKLLNINKILKRNSDINLHWYNEQNFKKVLTVKLYNKFDFIYI